MGGKGGGGCKVWGGKGGGARDGEGVEEGGGHGGAVPSSPFAHAGASSPFTRAGSSSLFMCAGPWSPFTRAGVGHSLSIVFVFHLLVICGGLAGRLWLWVSSSARCGWRWGTVTVRGGVLGGSCGRLWVLVGVVGRCCPWWWSWGVVGIGGVLWWVFDAGRVPVLVRGVGGLSWLFVVAGGHGGQLSHVVVCWWVRMGRLGWRCSPTDNDG